MSSQLQTDQLPSRSVSHNAVRSFNRFELKYLLTSGQANAFRDDFAQHVDLDPHAGPTGSYPLASLYYDTEDHRFYWKSSKGSSSVASSESGG